MRRAPQPEHQRLNWAGWALGAVGVLLLAAGTFLSGGWPFPILGFVAVVAAASLR